MVYVYNYVSFRVSTYFLGCRGKILVVEGVRRVTVPVDVGEEFQWFLLLEVQ